MLLSLKKFKKLKVESCSDEKKLNINKYWLFTSSIWSLDKINKHNSFRIKRIKKCILSGKKKKIAYNSNINSHILKKLASNGMLSNIKKSTW